MAKFTFLEVHLDGDFVANAPFSGGSELEFETDAGTDVRASEDAPEDGGRPWLAAVVGLLFLAVLAVLAKKKLGSDDEYEDYE